MTLSFQSHIPKADESRIFQYLMNLDYLFELLHTVKDLAKTLHSSILHNKSKIDKLEESNQAMKKQIGYMLSDQISSVHKIFVFQV
jgi:hypothetical protein